MEYKLKKAMLIWLTFSVAFFMSSGALWAATPAPGKEGVKATEATKPSEPPKKGEKFIIKDREYCYECIDNSECLGCHKKISERKFAQSVHGANSCNSCHWDIT
ncbi:MAG: hypothetical protein ACXU93_15770, partial [Thermodesulfobacteriota bacterium]